MVLSMLLITWYKIIVTQHENSDLQKIEIEKIFGNTKQSYKLKMRINHETGKAILNEPKTVSNVTLNSDISDHIPSVSVTLGLFYAFLSYFLNTSLHFWFKNGGFDFESKYLHLCLQILYSPSF